VRHVLFSKVLHLEGEEVFGSYKKRVDLLRGSDMDSHRLDKMNFSVFKVGGRVVKNKTSSNISPSYSGKASFSITLTLIRYGKVIMETKCAKNQFHIAWCVIQAKCFVFQSVSTRICKSTKVRTPTPIYV
jgi:hypothetical protein